MRSTNRKRALLISGAVILMCMTVIVGMTWALFTDTQTVSNHLQAGDLAITLNRTGLVKTYLTDSGYLEEEVVQTSADAAVNFTNPTDKNVFGLNTDANGNVTEKMVPGSKYVATMEIKNESDVAFRYWIRIECSDEDVAKALAEKLIITVYTDKNNDGVIVTTGDNAEGTGGKVSANLEVGGDTAATCLGTLGCREAETFIVSVEFKDAGYSYVNGKLTSTDDAAQTQSVDFDLIVYAVQETTAPTP